MSNRPRLAPPAQVDGLSTALIRQERERGQRFEVLTGVLEDAVGVLLAQFVPDGHTVIPLELLEAFRRGKRLVVAKGQAVKRAEPPAPPADGVVAVEAKPAEEPTSLDVFFFQVVDRQPGEAENEPATSPLTVVPRPRLALHP